MNFFPGVSSAIGPVPFSGSPAMNWTKSFMSAESPGLLLSLSQYQSILDPVLFVSGTAKYLL